MVSVFRKIRLVFCLCFCCSSICHASISEISGNIFIEAENPSSNTPGTAPYSSANWLTNNPPSGCGSASCSGGASIGSLPVTGMASALGTINGARNDYVVSINDGGFHYIWVRVLATSPTNNAVNIGVGGSLLTYVNEIERRKIIFSGHRMDW